MPCPRVGAKQRLGCNAEPLIRRALQSADSTCPPYPLANHTPFHASHTPSPTIGGLDVNHKWVEALHTSDTSTVPAPRHFCLLMRPCYEALHLPLLCTSCPSSRTLPRFYYLTLGLAILSLVHIGLCLACSPAPSSSLANVSAVLPSCTFHPVAIPRYGDITSFMGGVSSLTVPNYNKVQQVGGVQEAPLVACT